MSEIENRIRKFIQDQFIFDQSGIKLDDGFPLLENAILDSLGIFQVLAYINDQFGLEIPPEDIHIDNFTTIHSIAEMVRKARE